MQETESQAKLSLYLLAILIVFLSTNVLSVHNIRSGDDTMRIAIVQNMFGEPIPSAWVAGSARFSIVQPLLMAPVHFLDLRIYGEPHLLYLFNWIVMALSMVALYLLLKATTPTLLLLKLILVLLVASMFPLYFTNISSEMFSSMALMLGMAAIATDRSLLGIVLLALGGANSPALLPALLLMTLAFAIFRTRYPARRRLAPLVAPILAIGVHLLESKLRRGGWLISGYENDGVGTGKTILPYSGLGNFSYPLFLGLLNIFFSFGKGLIFYAPALFLRPAWSDENQQTPLREIYRMSLWFLAGMCIVYAKYWCWWGGMAWGPRYFLFASVPASIALATRLHYGLAREKLAPFTAAALLLSGWVGVNGLIFSLRCLLGYVKIVKLHPDMEHLFWYSPEFSALWRPLVTYLKIYPEDYLLGAIYCGAIALLGAPLILPLIADTRRLVRGLFD